MSSMKDLWGDTLATYPDAPGFQKHSDTSRAAAHSMRAHFNPQQQKIVNFLAILGAHGATYKEIVSGTGIEAASVCGRMVELCEAKKVTKTETTRPTPSGRQARVYVLAETERKTS